MHAVLQQVFDSYRAELVRKPADWCQLHPGQDERLWSAQELIEHLVLTCRSSTRLLQKRIDRGQPTADHSTPPQWLLQMIMLSFGRMPRGAPAPLFARPDQLHWPQMSGAELVDVLRQEIDQMDSILDVSRQRFGLQRVASHFVLGPLRPDQWRRFHVVHMRHHLGQLRRIDQAVSRPVAREAPSARV
jgi:DinB superfamily